MAIRDISVNGCRINNGISRPQNCSLSWYAYRFYLAALSPRVTQVPSVYIIISFKEAN